MASDQQRGRVGAAVAGRLLTVDEIVGISSTRPSSATKQERQIYESAGAARSAGDGLLCVDDLEINCARRRGSSDHASVREPEQAIAEVRALWRPRW